MYSVAARSQQLRHGSGVAEEHLYPLGAVGGIIEKDVHRLSQSDKPLIALHQIVTSGGSLYAVQVCRK
jgi:hypothetical protein